VSRGRTRARGTVALGLLISVFSIHPHGASAIGTAPGPADGTHTASVASDERCVHVVRRGESIGRIAARHGMTRNALVTANRLARPDAVRAGQRLKLPGCARGRSIPATASSGEAHRRSSAARSDPAPVPVPPLQEPKSRTDQAQFSWPVEGSVSSGYGRRGFWGWHSGVDIKAREGAPIRAAAPGTVMFSGWQSSYGRMIRIAHPNGLSTVYAHNLRNAVKVGDRVEAGTVIGAVGRTGRATAYHLHFEVRRQGRAQNPLSLLERREPGPMLAKQHDSD